MRGFFLKGTLVGFILGIALMLIAFFFTPFSARYMPVSGKGSRLYLVDQWTGDIWSCSTEITDLKYYIFGVQCVKQAYLP